MTELSEPIAGKRVVVTGGAGFLGARLVARLLDAGAHVRLVDDLSTGSLANVPCDHPRLEILRGSVTDPALVAKALEGAAIVFHHAARNIVVSTKNPREDFEVNIGGTLNVLLAARAHRVRRVVYASSASVYGNPRYLPIHEDDATNMLSPYAVSKFAGESYCKAFYESYGLSTTVLRYSNVYGPTQRPENPYCGVVAKFFDWVMKGEPPRIHGDGEQTRDFTYIDDAVEATLRAAWSPRADGQVYNVATGYETSINRLARLVLALVGSSLEPVYVDRRDVDNIRRRALNIEKARRELRWVPAVTLERGLHLTYLWLSEQAQRRPANAPPARSEKA